MDNPYQILGLNSNATFIEVKEQYRLLIQVWHPDKHINSPPKVKALADKKIRELTDAFESIKKRG